MEIQTNGMTNTQNCIIPYQNPYYHQPVNYYYTSITEPVFPIQIRNLERGYVLKIHGVEYACEDKESLLKCLGDNLK